MKVMILTLNKLNVITTDDITTTVYQPSGCEPLFKVIANGNLLLAQYCSREHAQKVVTEILGRMEEGEIYGYPFGYVMPEEPRKQYSWER